MNNVELGTNIATKEFATCGELFADGSCLELLSGNRLALMGEQEAFTGESIDCNGSRYRACQLDAALQSTLRLPREWASCSSTEYLVENLMELSRTRAGLDEVPSQLWATAILTTHLVNAVPVPVLNFWGAHSGSGAAAVQLTAALARRPLPVAELRFAELLKFPTGLSPTVIVSQPNASLLRYLLTASTNPGFVFLQKGRIVPFRCSLVVCTSQPVSFPALPFPLVAHPVSAYSPTLGELDALAQQWQPMLLDYRGRLWQRAATCTFDVPEFSAPVRQLARSLGAALADAPKLQLQLVEHLQAVDEHYRFQQGHGVIGAVMEALLALVLARTPRAYVHEVAALANQSLADRHEKAGLTPQVVGAVIREHVGLSPKRMAAGYRLELDECAMERILWLAEEMKISSTQPPPGDEAFPEVEPAAPQVAKEQVAELKSGGVQSSVPESGGPQRHELSSGELQPEDEQTEVI